MFDQKRFASGQNIYRNTRNIGGIVDQLVFLENGKFLGKNDRGFNAFYGERVVAYANFSYVLYRVIRVNVDDEL